MTTTIEHTVRAPGGSQFPNVHRALTRAHVLVAGAPAWDALRGLRAGAIGVFEILLQWQQRASQRSHFAALDDHRLKDMGLSRADVAREASKPFWRP
ncbi:MAG: DUF1127 domain-containing protein [Proteobacteria bacterium]|nr:DUF1127 domain-containing protein [Pseudomonadota bacterium]